MHEAVQPMGASPASCRANAALLLFRNGCCVALAPCPPFPPGCSSLSSREPALRGPSASPVLTTLRVGRPESRALKGRSLGDDKYYKSGKRTRTASISGVHNGFSERDCTAFPDPASPHSSEHDIFRAGTSSTAACCQSERFFSSLLNTSDRFVSPIPPPPLSLRTRETRRRTLPSDPSC